VLALAAALDIPVSEEPIGLDALRDADGVFLTGAIRGIEPVRGCDGAVVAAEERISATLARELELTWQGGAVHARID
jgi:branched-subunit amino acid aminotransferase/4-amino-4-deoxychorismate lyase